MKRLYCHTVEWTQAYCFLQQNARSVHPLPAHMHEDACATRQLHCQ